MVSNGSGCLPCRFNVALHAHDVSRNPATSSLSGTVAERRRGWTQPPLAALFFCSGACALIYQVLWLRLLGLVFGVTTYAATTVWASFMAGLAIGSLAAGALAERVRRPMAWFGAAELLIGGTALVTPVVLGHLQTIYIRVYPFLSDSRSVLTFVRFAMSFAVLIVPAVLMGATLPLVVKSSTVRRSTPRRILPEPAAQSRGRLVAIDGSRAP